MRLGFLLPLIFGYLVFRWLRSIINPAYGIREAFLFAAVIIGVYIIVVTELLSAFSGLTTVWVTLFWTAGSVATLFAAVVTRSHLGLFPKPSWKHLLKSADPLVTLLTILLLLIVGVQTVLAYFSVSNAWDSMTYHLARVAHWQQNQSIGIYATSCMYQNQHSPFAEWSILHLVLLQGNDHLANFIQWISYIGSIVAVSIITEQCGGTRRAGMIAAFFAATLPMALLQASTTENDEVMTFWMLTLAYGTLKTIRQPGWTNLLFTGASLGLALMTKAIAYLFAPAFVLWFSVILFQRGFRFAFPRLMMCGLVALTLNAGFYLRNLHSAGVFLGSSHDSGPGYNYENEIHGPGAIFSNVLRNFSLQTFQFPGVIKQTEAAVVKIHHLFGLDPSDPRITTYALAYYIPGGGLEDGEANPLQFLAILMALGLLLGYRRQFSLEVKLLVLAVCVGAFLFCVVLKWQPFHSRLHLSLLMLLLPMAALVLDTLKLRLMMLIFIACMGVEAGPLLFESDAHPFFGTPNIFQQSTMTQRFILRPENQLEYEKTLSLLHDIQVKLVGVIGPANNAGWEYPLFDPDVMSYAYPWRIEQVQVQNNYAPLETQTVPDAIISLQPSHRPFALNVHGQAYHQVLQGRVLSVYTK